MPVNAFNFCGCLRLLFDSGTVGGPSRNSIRIAASAISPLEPIHLRAAAIGIADTSRMFIYKDLSHYHSRLGIHWLLRDYTARKEPHYHQEHK